MTITLVLENAMRLDKALALNSDFTRSFVQKLADDGCIFSEDGAVLGKKTLAKNNDVITINLPESKPLDVIAQDIPLDIIFEDDYLIVINKPKGMVVHPAPGHSENTLVNALLHHCKDSLSGIGGVNRPGILHRLDKDTSGLILVAKSDFSHQNLAEQLKNRDVKRVYHALVHGVPKKESAIINAPIGRHKTNRQKMAVISQNSRDAVTHYTLLKSYDRFSLVEFALETGRTHQIRVHAAHINNPVAGDPLYTNRKTIGLTSQALHAKKLGFTHPFSGKYLEFEAPLPSEFNEFLKYLENGE